MAIAPAYTPPAYTTTNVLYGVGILFTAPVNTAVPSDLNLGVGTSVDHVRAGRTSAAPSMVSL